MQVTKGGRGEDRHTDLLMQATRRGRGEDRNTSDEWP